MEDLNLSEQSVDVLRQLAINEPVNFFKNFLEEIGESLNTFDYDGGPNETINGFELASVYSEGGTEGGGEHAEVVVGIFEGENDLAYIRLTGYYCSYEGTEWHESSIEQVYPREVVVTQYFNTKE